MNEAAAKAADPHLALIETGEGPAFVFQHGLCGDAAQTAEVFPADAPFRCMTLECRGHGGSEAGAFDALSLATFADDVAAMIEREAVAPVVLGGISMGAAIALRLAVTRPELVRALVLARPAWVLEAAPPNLRAYAEVGDLLARLPADEARAVFERSDTAARLQREAPDNLASLRGFFTRAPQPLTAALLIRVTADGPRVTAEEVAALRLPTLVIGHGKDEAHPLAYAERLAALIPNARLAAITPKAESRERYAADFRAALRAFLVELAPPAG